MSQQPIRWALWILAMAALAVMLALAGQYGDGYVVFVVPPWRVELSVMLFSIILLALFSLFHWLIRLGQGALKLPGMFKMLKLERARTRAREAMLAGIKALMAGQYREAEQYARRAMSSESARADTRDLAAVIAARAAQESGNPAASLPYLARIRNPKSADMRDVTQAQMLLSESRAEEALTLLKPLAANNPRNAAVLKMKVEAEVLQQNWKDALQTLELLTRSGLLPEAAAQQIRLNAETKLIQAAPNDRETLLNQWRRLDSSARYDVGIIDIMARRLIALDHGEDARNIIEEAIDARGDEQWDSSLIALYADCKGDSTLAQIERAEKWLKTQARDAVLLATLGKLCIRQALWGKAQSYLEASVALKPSRDAHMTLAGLMEKTGRPEEAIRHIRRSAQLAN